MYTEDDQLLDEVRANIKKAIENLGKILLNDNSEYRKDYLQTLAELQKTLIEYKINI